MISNPLCHDEIDLTGRVLVEDGRPVDAEAERLLREKQEALRVDGPPVSVPMMFGPFPGKAKKAAPLPMGSHDDLAA